MKYLIGIFTTLFVLVCHSENSVWVVDIDGGIGPATADHVSRGLKQAKIDNAHCIVLRINTPGGLDLSMRDIISAILASPVPVVVYVAPSGSRAASAGTYILYAAHIAAMAPATTIGAATPVQIGSPGVPQFSDKNEDTQIEQIKTAMEEKIINDAVAYIEGLAQLRGRNPDWAKKAVIDADSITANVALQIGVINVLANDLDDLLEKIHDKTVNIAGSMLTLKTQSADLHYFERDWRNKFLSVITDPSLAYILLLVGVYGLILEFSQPGLGAGIIGAICLLTAFYAFQLLPISYTGLALIALGVVLIVAEAFAPSFGVLGIGGIVAFIYGSIVLMDTELPAYQIALPLIITMSVLSAFLLIMVITLLARGRKRSPVTGLSTMIGQQAVVENTYNGQPKVRINGELWQVLCEESLQINDFVEIVAAQGIVLKVRKSLLNKQRETNGN